MTLNLIFLTVTIKARKRSVEERMHDEYVNRLLEDHKARQEEIYRNFY
ncbi:YrzI family small protein [Cytobacillus sp. FSL W7-1323]|uniref:YrzI family protein n=2 Tax=Cytobacillus TaxID=2675230 RepID=A0A248TL38_9BACI|nr:MULTISPECIES: YrzI family small protein [Cytobacillus]ASV68917.1 YrzI family protein [Cytobacillus kochii]MBD7935767.1 YrzI family small protein [Cytobacillus stercorigallinarum]MDQ0183638.1 uncharacterized protein (TIGR02413 family) [Cytobacillus kochii]MEA1853189.1 YrzI family small protein [Cytobacillus sp. OWB-43]MED1607477.1 YrzI family small protein [Cytobacillus kochii]